MDSDNAERPKLPMPGEKMESKRALVYLRKYPDGSHKLIESAAIKYWKGDYETPTELMAFDSRGEELFSPKGIVAEGESDGWRYQTVQRKNGLPVSIRSEKVGKESVDLLYEELVNSAIEQLSDLPEEVKDNPEKFQQEIERVSRIINIEYDDQDRPIKRSVFREINWKAGSLFKDKKIFTQTEEETYHFDNQGRILMSANYEFVDGSKKLSRATLYEYLPIGNDKVRLIRRGYTSIRDKDIQEGATISLVDMTEYNLKDNRTIGYAVYETEERSLEENLTDYERAKRNPIVQRFVKKTPPDGVELIEREALPGSISSPSYLTAKDIDLYLHTESVEDIGTSAELERRVRVLFQDEYIEIISDATDKEAFECAAQILSGELIVRQDNNPVDIIRGYQKAAIDSRLGILQRVALFASFLPMYAKEINLELTPKDDIDRHILLFLQVLAVDEQYRKNLDLSPDKFKGLKNSEITIDVLYNLEEFSDKVIARPEDFANIL